jgi:hypothetical protein
MAFAATSRYYSLATATITLPDGRVAVYVTRRFLPSPDRFSLLQEYVVVQGDRLDNITARFLKDPEQFWRLSDANGAMRPEGLTESVGRHLRITLPEGLPGMPNV